MTPHLPTSWSRRAIAALAIAALLSAASAQVFVANSNNNTLLSFSTTANGNVVPSATISDATNLATPYALAIDTNRIYEANPGVGEIAVYARTANGASTPAATIANPGITFPVALAVDANYLYLVNNDQPPPYGTGASIIIFSVTASGAATPVATIAGSNTGLNFPQGIAVGAGNIYVSNTASNTITVYPILTGGVPTTGNVTPSLTISGAATGLNSPCGIAMNTSSLFVVNAGAPGGTPSISVFPVSASGNAAPTATISGSSTGLSANAYGVAVDAGSIYVSQGPDNLINVYALSASGNVAPTATISGTATTLNGPIGIAVSATATSTLATPTVTVNVGTYTYNGAPNGPQASDVNAGGSTGAITMSYAGTGATTYGPSSTRPTAAGSYTATASVAADASYSAGSSTATAFTIGRATATVTAASPSKLYDGTALAVGNPGATGLAPGDTITGFTGTTSVGPAVGSYPTSVTAVTTTNGAANYTFSFVAGAATISQPTPTISSVAPRAGFAATTTTVTIFGSNFGAAASAITVSYGPNGTGSWLTGVQWVSATELTGNVGTNVFANVPVKFVVTVNGVSSAASTATYTGTAIPTATVATAASATASLAAQTVTLSANVTAGGSPVGSGTLTFTVYHGVGTVGQLSTVSVANGVATFAYGLPAGTLPGTYTIDAAYNGDTTRFAPSSDSTQTLTVAGAGTTTTVSPSTAVLSLGTAVPLSASVASAAGTVNTGTVTFTVQNATGTTLGSAVTVNVANGAASGTYALPTTAAQGTYTISAVYTPGGIFAPSNGKNALTVAGLAPTTTTATAASATIRGPSKIATIGSGVSNLAAFAADPSGNLYYATKGGATTTISEIPLGGAPTTFASVPVAIKALGLGVDASGKVQATFTDGNNQIWLGDVPKGSTNPTFTSTGGYSQALTFAVSASGVPNIAFTDGINQLWVYQDGNFTNTGGFANGSVPLALNLDAAGNPVVAFADGNKLIWVYSASGFTKTGVTVTAGQVPAVDGSGTIYVADRSSGVVSKAASNGALVPVVTGLSAPTAMTFDTAGNLYVACAGDGSVTEIPVTASATLSATVTSALGKVIEGTVTFTVLDAKGNPVGTPVTSSTVSNGAATVTYRLPAVTAPGSYTIKAAYNPATSGSFAASSDSSKQVTLSSPSTLSLSPANQSAEVGNEATVTATLLSASGAPVSGASVIFSVTSGPDAGGGQTVLTDAAGKASYSLKGQAGTDVISATTPTAASAATAYVKWAAPVSISNNISRGTNSNPSLTGIRATTPQITIVLPRVSRALSLGIKTVSAAPSGGSMASVMSADLSRGVLVGYLSGTNQGFMAEFSADAQGNFSITTTATGAGSPTTLTITGTATASEITGTIQPLGLTFDGISEAATGPTTALAGVYVQPNVNGAGGTTVTLVGTQGTAYVLSLTPGAAAAGNGTLDPVSGAITAQLSSGASVSETVNAAAGTISGTIAGATTPAVAFSGAAGQMGTAALVNVSALGSVAPGSPLVTGFVVSGPAQKTVLLRAVGPGLSGFGVKSPLATPILTLYDGAGHALVANAGWGGSAVLAGAFAQAGAFALSPTNADAALEIALSPGSYTAVVSDGANDAGGVALAEVYDLSPDLTESSQSLVNESTLGKVTPTGPLTAGFVIDGNSPKRVLVRAVGPGLAVFGVGAPLGAPTLTVSTAAGTPLARNNAWGTPAPLSAGQSVASASDITAAEANVGAFPLPSGGKDSALIVTLAPGAYTASVNSADGSSGAALVEIYELR